MSGRTVTARRGAPLERPIHVMVSTDDEEALISLAAADATTLSAIVRRALRDYLRRNPRI